MPARRKPFFVLWFGDRDQYGFDETALPLLVRLLDSARPDYREWCTTGVTGYFIASARAAARVEKVVRQAEVIRQSDPRFVRLGIGLGEGELLAEFTWLGRPRRTGIAPLGSTADQALRLISAEPDGYRSVLNGVLGRYRKR